MASTASRDRTRSPRHSRIPDAQEPEPEPEPAASEPEQEGPAITDFQPTATGAVVGIQLRFSEVRILLVEEVPNSGARGASD